MPSESPNTNDSLGFADRPELGVGSSPGAIKLANFLQAMNGWGLDADANYRHALKDMKRNALEVTTAIVRAESCCARCNYNLRWSLVYAAVQIHHVSTLSFLRDLVLTEIPQERKSASHSMSTVAEETIICTTAVEGIGYFAKRRSRKALDFLLEFLSIPSISIRRASVQEILKVGKKYRRKIATCLPPEFHYLLDVEPKNVKDVPQIKNPKRHLKKRKLINFDKSPAPALKDEGLNNKMQHGPNLTKGG